MRIALFLLALILPVTAAHATVSRYYNPTFGYFLTYPDNWMPQTEPPGLPHTYKIVADEGRGTGFCQITSDEDRRFVIYGPKHQADLMQRELGADFWSGWLASNTDVVYLDVRERNGLGSGSATRVLVDYIDPQGMPMRSWKAATIHGGVRYVAECASTQEDFSKYETMFHSIIATLRMKPAFTPFPQGFYSNFTKDRPVVFPLSEGIGSGAF